MRQVTRVCSNQQNIDSYVQVCPLKVILSSTFGLFIMHKPHASLCTFKFEAI